jgi:tripartite-type tricarboxylate transporter receptor subunit TctC
MFSPPANHCRRSEKKYSIGPKLKNRGGSVVAQTSVRIGCCALFWALALLCGAAAAAEFPTKSVRFIVPWPAGGGADFLSRVVSEKLSERWQRTVVVDNRGGAGGILGTELAAKAPADGYTWFLCTTPSTITPALHGKVSFDLMKDFVPVILLASAPYVLAAHPSVPVKSVPELIAYAKSNPGRLSYSSSGNGSAPHLAGELFKTRAGVQMTHVPYKGTAPALADTIAGHVQLTFANLVPTLPQVRSGKLRGLAVTGAQRVKQLPELPTIAESVLPGFQVTVWYGIEVPAGTPKHVVTTMNRDINEVLRLPEVAERLSREGATPIGGTPAEFGAHIQSELRKWAQTVRDSGAKAD